MPWVITKLCRDCVDMSCVEVCPVDCIYEYKGEDRDAFPNQLYIDPEECIDCGVCEPECPWEAIFEDERVPDVVPRRHRAERGDHRGEGRVPGARGDREGQAEPEQVAANKVKWGFAD